MANILIVDDSRTSRRILRGILESAGHTIVGEAKDGKEGVDLFRQLSPELVTMDITMPVVDGVEAMKVIHEMGPDAKVVMVTAAGQKGKVVECLRDGASEFITKPLDADKIIETIAKVLAD